MIPNKAKSKWTGIYQRCRFSKWFYRTAIRQFYKRILRRGLWITLPNGLRYYCPRNDSQAEAYVTRGLVDWGAELKMLEYLDPSAIAIDMGARTGLYSLMIGKSQRK